LDPKETMTDTRNSVVLADFVRFCEAHPDLRFWQALAVWCKSSVFVLRSGSPANLRSLMKGPGHEFDLQDSFYWEGRDS